MLTGALTDILSYILTNTLTDILTNILTGIVWAALMDTLTGRLSDSFTDTLIEILTKKSIGTVLCEIISLDKGYFRFRMLFGPDIQEIYCNIFQKYISLITYVNSMRLKCYSWKTLLQEIYSQNHTYYRNIS